MHTYIHTLTCIHIICTTPTEQGATKQWSLSPPASTAAPSWCPAQERKPSLSTPRGYAPPFHSLPLFSYVVVYRELFDHMSSCFVCITACLIQVCLNTSVLRPRPAFCCLLGGACERGCCLTTSVLYLAADVYTFCMASILSNNRITGRFVHAPWSDCSR